MPACFDAGLLHCFGVFGCFGHCLGRKQAGSDGLSMVILLSLLHFPLIGSGDLKLISWWGRFLATPHVHWHYYCFSVGSNALRFHALACCQGGLCDSPSYCPSTSPGDLSHRRDTSGNTNLALQRQLLSTQPHQPHPTLAIVRCLANWRSTTCPQRLYFCFHLLRPHMFWTLEAGRTGARQALLLCSFTPCCPPITLGFFLS